jgi:hypothetical protein
MRIRKPFVRAVACFCILWAASCGGLNEREADLFRQAEEAFAQGVWSTALEEASLVTAAKPEFLPARLLKGKALFELGKLAEALAELEALRAIEGAASPTQFPAILYSGRCLIELGRSQLPDVAFHAGGAPVEASRSARDFFVRANAALLDALALEPESYDAALWRGYCVLRLENHRKAADLLAACGALDARRWEHRFFRALALEGLYRTNAESLNTYLDLAASGPRPQVLPVVEHLTLVHSRVTPELGHRIFTLVRDFDRSVPLRSARIRDFLAQVEEQIDREERRVKLASTEKEVRDLLTQKHVRLAMETVRAYLQDEPGSEELAEPLARAKEEWSQLIEAGGEGLVADAGAREELETALAAYELARTLTRQIDRLVVLQQKINAARLALARKESSEKLQGTYEILKAGEHAKVLEALGAMAVDDLSERDRDLYHYLRGVASYRLGHLLTAAKAFGEISRRDFEDLGLLQGLALMGAGQKAAGAQILAGLPPAERDDEVNRVLGRHFLEQGDLQKAVGCLSLLALPTQEDGEIHCRARRELGMEHYRRGEYAKAVTHLEAACQILETQTLPRPPEIYLFLANSYYRLDDLERAKKVYQDLSDSGLTQSERTSCRDLFLFRGQIHLRERQADLAYRDLSEFLRLGGRLSDELRSQYGRLVATYGDFVPLDKVEYWNYVSTGKDYNYTLHVTRKDAGAYRVVRRESGNTVSEEVWQRQGIYLMKEVGEAIFKLPVNLNPGETDLPVIEYESRDLQCLAEIVEIDQTVEIQGKRTFEHCIKVRAQQKSVDSSGDIHRTRHIFYFAPDVGEVMRTVYRDDVKVSEIVLSEFATRDELLAN